MSPKNLFAAIAISHRVEGSWSARTIAPFSGEYQDIEAMFSPTQLSPDGNRLFFASTRPKPTREGADWDSTLFNSPANGLGDIYSVPFIDPATLTMENGS